MEIFLSSALWAHQDPRIVSQQRTSMQGNVSMCLHTIYAILYTFHTYLPKVHNLQKLPLAVKKMDF